MAYVYRHIRLDKNEPFYIGIGSDSNGDYKRANDKNRWHNPLWKRITEKTGYEVEIMIDNIEWDVACSKEIEFIKLYGRIDRGTGTLANLTDGGDGNLGLVHSEEALKKISEASKGRVGHWKGKKMSDEFKRKISESRKGKPNLKLRGRKGSKRMVELLKQRNIGNSYHLGKKHTDESKKKMSDGMKGRIAYNRKPVFQYSLDGIFIKKHDCISNAKKETGAKEIYKVCTGSRKSSGCYLWSFIYKGDKIDKYVPDIRRKSVIKLTIDGVFIKEYNNANEAAKDNGISSVSIRKVCKGIIPCLHNFKWQYKN